MWRLFLVMLPAWGGSLSAQLADTAWPKYQHDLRNSGCSPAVGPSAPVLKWYAPVQVESLSLGTLVGWDGEIYASWVQLAPPYSPGRITILWKFGMSYLSRLDPSGRFDWQRRVSETSSMPTLSGDRTIYYNFGGDFNFDSKMWSWTSSGLLNWGPIWVEPSFRSAPTIGKEGTLFFPGFYSFYALHPDGSIKWKRNEAVSQQCPSMGEDGTLYVGVGKGLRAIDPETGASQWFLTLSDVAWYPSTTIAQDGTIYVFGYRNSTGLSFNAVNPNGTVKWSQRVSYREPPFRGVSLGSDGTIYFGLRKENGQKGAVVAWDPNGFEKWRIETQAGIYAPVVVDGAGNLYARTYNDQTLEQQLISYTKDGFFRWSFRTSGNPVAAPSMGDDGALHIFSTLEGEQYSRLVAIGPGPGPHKTFPYQVTAINGQVTGGERRDLKKSDDRYLVLKSAQAPSPGPFGPPSPNPSRQGRGVVDPSPPARRGVQQVVCEFEQIMPGAGPLTMDFSLEGHALAPLPWREGLGEGVQYSVELYDFTDNQWKPLTTGTFNSTDSLITIPDIPKPFHYINPDTLRLKVRLTAQSSVPFQLYLDELHLGTTYP